MASSVFIDNGNSFFSDAELDELRENYAEVLTENTPTILDNHYYKFQDLAKYPQYLLSRNYTSTGISLSFISPVGPINAFVSWPLKEPVSDECEQGSTKCFKRGKQNKHFYENFKFDINIGTEY